MKRLFTCVPSFQSKSAYGEGPRGEPGRSPVGVPLVSCWCVHDMNILVLCGVIIIVGVFDPDVVVGSGES